LSAKFGEALNSVLFLIYINDLYTASEVFKLMFADDTAGLVSEKTLTPLWILSIPN
jgi:hypothetical protein